jgi:CubicO group peptidase (beta-lactamase class C family)
MNAWARSVVALILVGSCSLVAGGANDEPTIRQRAAAAMAGLQERGFSGSVLLACGHQVLFQGDYGGTAAGKDRTARYWVASVTKALTAVAVLQLAESGDFRQDDPLTAFFSELPEDKRAITVFQLLTHQSGLPQNYAAEGFAERDAASRSVFAQPLSFEPGSGFQYSNDNYSLLGMVLEVVSGQSYREVIGAVLARPLGIEAVAFWPDPVRDDEWVPPLSSPPAANGSDWGYLGGHGARLSVGELHTLTVALLDGRLLSPASLALLFGPNLVRSSGTGVGMGWYRETDADGRRLLWSRGYDTSGANAVVYVVEATGAIVVAATNSGPAESEGPGWSREARDALLPMMAPLDGVGPCGGGKVAGSE